MGQSVVKPPSRRCDCDEPTHAIPEAGLETGWAVQKVLMRTGAVQMAFMNDGDSIATTLGANLTLILGSGGTAGPSAGPGIQDAVSPGPLPSDLLPEETSSQGAASPRPLPWDAVPQGTSLEPLTVPALTSLGVDPAAGATVLKSQPAGTAGSTGSMGAAPAPGPAGNILRKIFKAEPRCVWLLLWLAPP